MSYYVDWTAAIGCRLVAWGTNACICAKFECDNEQWVGKKYLLAFLSFFGAFTSFTYIRCTPNKHAGSDPQAFWLRPVMAITASVQPESGRNVYAWFDFQHPFQICFSKEVMDHIVLWQNRPGSDLDGLVRVWRNASGLEASRCAGTIGPGFWEDTTGPLPVFHFQTRLQSSTDVPDDIVKNQLGSDLVLADCVRF